jgi:demethylmenaquinone methyltransferase/2-methoxy-6-polyprenyl-1,4-benzoquinol methylase
LSHVPPEKLHAFLTKVRRALKPGGKAFMVDSRRDQTSTAPDQPLPQGENIRHQRTLNDGRTFTIVKVYYEPEPLCAAFEAAGFDADVRTTPRYFIYAAATAR